MIKKILISLLFIIIILVIFGWYEVSKNSSKQSYIEKILPEDIKNIIKQTVFYIPNLKNKYENLYKQFEEYEHKFNEIGLKRTYQWKNLSSLIELGYFELERNKSPLINPKTVNAETTIEPEYIPLIYETSNYQFTLDKFFLPFLDRNSWLKKPTAYIEIYQDTLWLVSGDGLILNANFSDFFTSKAKFKLVNSNFRQENKSNLLFDGGGHSVKDLYLDKNYIYLSYTKEQKEDCYNTSIIRAKINLEYLIFEDFFTYDECQSINNDEYVAIQSGGRIEKRDESSIFFTIGDFRNRTLAQDYNSLFGKVLSINTNDASYTITSLGHRNPQGLYFDKNRDILFMTEHGPKGGDEFNINKQPNSKEIENYGWPISSYGKHYDGKVREEAPLHNSHKKFGYIEPIKYYVPSIAISDIENFNIYENYPKDNQFFIAALGGNIDMGHMSLHHVVINDNMEKIIKSIIIPVNERIRDIKYIKEKKAIILMLETSPAIGILNFSIVD